MKTGLQNKVLGNPPACLTCIAYSKSCSGRLEPKWGLKPQMKNEDWRWSLSQVHGQWLEHTKATKYVFIHQHMFKELIPPAESCKRRAANVSWCCQGKWEARCCLTGVLFQLPSTYLQNKELRSNVMQVSTLELQEAWFFSASELASICLAFEMDAGGGRKKILCFTACSLKKTDLNLKC